MSFAGYPDEWCKPYGRCYGCQMERVGFDEIFLRSYRNAKTGRLVWKCTGCAKLCWVDAMLKKTELVKEDGDEVQQAKVKLESMAISGKEREKLTPNIVKAMVIAGVTVLLLCYLSQTASSETLPLTI